MTRVALFAALILSVASAVHAQHAPTDSLDSCESQLVSAVESGGGHFSPARHVGFLREGENAVFREEIGDQAACVGFVALGHKRVRDLDLALFTETGTSLAEDVATDSHPYIRFCGAPHLVLEVVVRMYVGQGEYRLLRIENAPPTLNALESTLRECVGPVGGGPEEKPPDIGREPEPASLGETLARERTRLRELGYIPTSLGSSGTAREGQTVNVPLGLGTGDCYAVLAVGDGGIQDLDLAVTGNDHHHLIRDVSRESTALVRICADEPRYTAEIRAYRGGGAFRIEALRLVEPAGQRVLGAIGLTRAAYGEWAARASARGLSVRALTWGSAAAGESLDVPVTLLAGHCYAFGALPGPELESGDLDVILKDSAGRLLAADLGPDSSPTVYRCAVTNESLYVSTQLRGAARARFLVVLGQDESRGASNP